MSHIPWATDDIVPGIPRIDEPSDREERGAVSVSTDGWNVGVLETSVEVRTKMARTEGHSSIVRTDVDNTTTPSSNASPYQESKWIDPKIRKWGCHRMETPLIFVHIGKAGGGTTRARFAAAAHNYNRTHWYMTQDDQHFYPSVNASFCTSQYHTWKTPTRLGDESFEGNLPCSATTPIGMALGCPEALAADKRCRGCQDLSSKQCRVVYMGHNSIGSELHWLSPHYLRKWWRTSTFANLTIDWRVAYPEPYIWCLGRRRHHRPMYERRYRELYDQCSVPISNYWDEKVQEYWTNRSSIEGDDPIPLNYAPIYASMPLQRVTLLREPWSWLVSKFFWHHDLDTDEECDDFEYAKEWAHQYVIQYAMYLCGDDCAIRLELGRMTMEEIWIQSESNLRRSFSVVGLLNESSTFYEMISTRVGYLDMNRNPHVNGDRHTGRNKKTRYCHALFLQEDFRVKFRIRIPAVMLLERLYQVAEEVNRFQLKELTRCRGSHHANNHRSQLEVR
jgi:hypothetical protein